MAVELFLTFVGRNSRLCAFVGLGSGLLTFFLATLFPELGQQDASAVSSSWPDMMKTLFGDPLFAFSDVYAWLHLEIFHITFWLIHGGLAALLASRILATEAEEKSLDILLSVPISRTRILTSRLAGLTLLSVLTALPVVAGCGLGIRALGLPVDAEPLILATLAGVLLALVMAGLTLCVSVWVPRQTHCIFLALALVAFLFMLEEMLVELVPVLRGLAAINPFHYYGAAEILVHDSGAGWGPLVLLTMFLALAAFSMLGFARRDIPA
jgi:ABC-2 type transport system permease protein